MAEHLSFKRNIGLFGAVMIGIGAMMGPGVFALPGELAGAVGPLGIFVYLAMGAMTLFTALNYAELGAAIPIAGGGYSFTSRTLPKPLAFFTGWFFWIGNTLACAMYAVIFAVTVRAYFWPGASIPLIVVAVTLLFTAVNWRGMSEALFIITIMNLIELAVLMFVGVLGLVDIEPANLEPLAPHGYGGFFSGMALIYVSYVGFELITVAAEEIKDPGRVIPRAILITLGVGVLIYALIVTVMMGVVPAEELSKTDVPFIYVADRLFGAPGRWAGIIATVMASLSAFSVTLGASARILYALGRDGHFPKVLCTLHKKHRTPHIALMVCAVAVAIFGSSGVLALVASIADFGYLMGLGLVNFAVIALHRRMPNLRRPFNNRWYPWIPLIGVVTCWIFVPALHLESLLLGLGLTAVGAVTYLWRAENRAQMRALPRAFARMVQFLRSLWRRRMRVLIIDGGRQGRNIADRLLAQDELRLAFREAQHQITFVDEDEANCRALEQRYGVPIYHGDGTKQSLLTQVGKDNVDVAIAAFPDDGRNMIAALQAKRLGIPQVMAIIDDPDYMPLLESEGIIAISAPWATAGMVEDRIDRPGVANLINLGGGVANLVSLVVPEGARVHGRRIKEIDVPADCVVAAVLREEKFVVPRGDTAILVGDNVVFVGTTAATKSARELFSNTKK
jgi:amino acid transporter/Trk K+ transport system NAD-binding subunit